MSPSSWHAGPHIVQKVLPLFLLARAHLVADTFTLTSAACTQITVEWLVKLQDKAR